MTRPVTPCAAKLTAPAPQRTIAAAPGLRGQAAPHRSPLRRLALGALLAAPLLAAAAHLPTRGSLDAEVQAGDGANGPALRHGHAGAHDGRLFPDHAAPRDPRLMPSFADLAHESAWDPPHRIERIWSGPLPGASHRFPRSFEAAVVVDARDAPADAVVPLTAVPESEIYALMLAGLCIVGLAARRGRRA